MIVSCVLQKPHRGNTCCSGVVVHHHRLAVYLTSSAILNGAKQFDYLLTFAGWQPRSTPHPIGNGDPIE